MFVCCRIDQLDIDPHPVSRPLHTAFQDCGRTQFLADRLQVLRRVAVLHDRRTGNDLQGTDLGDLGQDVVMNTIDRRTRSSGGILRS